MCTPCSKPHPPPNWRSISRVVVTSYHVFIGSGTGAMHTHGPHYTHVGIPCASLCHFTILLCHWSLWDSKVTHKCHLLSCFPHDMHNSSYTLFLGSTSWTHATVFFSHQLRKDSMSTCKTVESYLSRTSSNLLLSEHLKLTTPSSHLALPPSHLTCLPIGGKGFVHIAQCREFVTNDSNHWILRHLMGEPQTATLMSPN